jgi:AraC-like DNA-binding protein
MAGPDLPRQPQRDRLAATTTHSDEPSGGASIVHEKLTNSVQNEVEKQTSYRSLRVASLAVTRTGTYAGARVFGTEMDEHESQPAPEAADESLAWLDFLEECRQVLSQSEDDAREPASLTPALFETASRLRTRTARVLARVMITRLAERLATAASAAKASTDRVPLDVTSADSLLQSSAPAVIDPRVRTVLQYVESRHVNSACRLDDVARNLRVSRSYLSRLVFKETGVTFNRHLQLARMNTAARLLQESELSIKEISSGTGYEHVPSFDRQFRSHFNLTPGDFRRAVRLS